MYDIAPRKQTSADYVAVMGAYPCQAVLRSGARNGQQQSRLPRPRNKDAGQQHHSQYSRLHRQQRDLEW